MHIKEKSHPTSSWRPDTLHMPKSVLNVPVTSHTILHVWTFRIQNLNALSTSLVLFTRHKVLLCFFLYGWVLKIPYQWMVFIKDCTRARILESRMLYGASWIRRFLCACREPRFFFHGYMLVNSKRSRRIAVNIFEFVVVVLGTNVTGLLLVM